MMGLYHMGGAGTSLIWTIFYPVGFVLFIVGIILLVVGLIDLKKNKNLLIAGIVFTAISLAAIILISTLSFSNISYSPNIKSENWHQEMMEGEQNGHSDHH